MTCPCLLPSGHLAYLNKPKGLWRKFWLMVRMLAQSSGIPETQLCSQYVGETPRWDATN